MKPGKEIEDGKFEKVLARCGNAGKYQNAIFWGFLAPLNFIIAWVALGPILLSATPDHWCNVSGKPEGMDESAWINLTVPRKEDGSLEKCLQFKLDPIIQQFSEETTACLGNFSYSTDDYDRTLTSHHNWVCENSDDVANWLSVGRAGAILGTLLFNTLSDVYGRRLLFVLTTLVHGIGGVARVYVESYWLVMLSQFVASMALPAMLEISLILVYELVTSRWRSRVTANSFVSWSFGTCFLGLLAYLSRSDQTLTLITCLPFLGYMFAYKWIPESPRWLLSRGRVDEAYELMIRVAEINGNQPPADLHQKLKEISIEKEPHYGVLQLLKTPRMRIRTLLLCGCYMMNNLFFYGLAYNITNMAGNDFLNFFLLGLSELPSNLFGWWASLNVGRRWTQTFSFFFAGTFTLIMLFVGENPSPWLNITLLTISKFFITTSFQVIYLQTAELFPTTHCATGVGFASIISSSVGVCAPYIAHSGNKDWWLPYVILTCIGYLGFIVSSFVPETLDTSLPQSLQEAEDFLSDVPYWSYRGRKFWKCGREKPNIENSYGATDDQNVSKSNDKVGIANPAFPSDSI